MYQSIETRQQRFNRAQSLYDFQIPESGDEYNPLEDPEVDDQLYSMMADRKTVDDWDSNIEALQDAVYHLLNAKDADDLYTAQSAICIAFRTSHLEQATRWVKEQREHY